MARHNVYQEGNTVVLLNTDTNEMEYIALNVFSFEVDSGTIQFVDSSIDKRVISMLVGEVQDAHGTAIGDEADVVAYLTAFSTPAGTLTLEAGSQIAIVDENGNPMDQQNGFGNEVTRGFFLMGEDENGFARRIRTEPDGRLISSASVTNPPGSTSIVEAYQSNVGTSDDQDYIIPNGQYTILQALSGGAEGDVDGSKVELWHFTDGTKTVGTLLSALYVNGSNGNDNLNVAYVGDGNARITLRRSRLAGSGKEIFGKWIGYHYL